MTNRNRFFDGAILAQLVEHQTFNLRLWVRVPYRAQMEFFMFVLCMETTFLDYADRKCSPLLKLFSINACII